MRKVAERLGVGTMSLYTYVPGKAELLDLMVDASVGPSTTVDGRWRERLEQIAREQWERYHRHPWLLEITMVRPVLGPNVTARYEHELQAIDGIGLTDIEMDAVDHPDRRPRRGRGPPRARGRRSPSGARVRATRSGGRRARQFWNA